MKKNKNVLVIRQPATRWQDALPTGNGSIGALVYGHIRNEIIILNHEALWLRQAKPTVPDISKALPELRKLIAAGKYRQAEGFYDQLLKDHDYTMRVDPYHPAFDIEIETQTQSAFTDYQRALDLETGEVTVTWKENKTSFSRKVFVSRADDVVVLKFQSAPSGRNAATIRLIPHNQQGATGMGSGQDVKAPEIPITFNTGDRNGWLTLRGKYDDGGEFGGIAWISAGKSSFRNASEVLVLVKLFANEESGPALARLRKEIAKLPHDYNALLKGHVKLHKELFQRVTLDLEDGGLSDRSNDELLAAGYQGRVPTALIERMFSFGRFLLITSSRPGGLPANLQGVWNGDYDPAWSADYHNDENIQMNYWQALAGNLPETTLPYFDYYESVLDDYRENARSLYGCRGILAPIAQSTHGKIHPGAWQYWTAGAGWLAQLFYDYWLFTGDRKFLEKRAVPFLKEVAFFYEDFLIEDEHGKLMFSPSLSPENIPSIPEGGLTTVNATMDIAVAREVLHNLCDACATLGIEKDGLARWQNLLKKLPDYEINADGAIKEWIHPALPDNYHHRHQSHIYPLFPGLEVTRETDKKLFTACRVAVEKRLVIGLTSQTGWSLAHMANIYARLGEGNRALECLELLTRSCVGPNLFTYHNDWRSQGLTMFWGHGNHPPFQIDANFGAAAAVLEMLIFSKPGLIKLLPALPEKWSRGKVRGLCCRGGVKVSIEWNLDKKTIRAELVSSTGQQITLQFPKRPRSLKSNLPPKDITPSSYGPAYKQLRLPPEKKVALKITF